MTDLYLPTEKSMPAWMWWWSCHACPRRRVAAASVKKDQKEYPAWTAKVSAHPKHIPAQDCHERSHCLRSPDQAWASGWSLNKAAKWGWRSMPESLTLADTPPCLSP